MGVRVGYVGGKKEKGQDGVSNVNPSDSHNAHIDNCDVILSC